MKGALVWLAMVGGALLSGCVRPGSGSVGGGAEYPTTSVRIGVGFSIALSTSAALPTADQVAAVAIDVSQAGAALVSGQELAKTAGVWGGSIDNLPVGPSLTFAGHAYDSARTEIFRGSATQVLTGSNDTATIALAAVGTPIVDLPRITQITAPSAVLAASTTEILVAVAYRAGATLSYAFTASAGAFDPAQGSTINFSNKAVFA